MKLRDVLKMIDKDYAPAYEKDRREIDCTKNGVWKVILCFEAEEETTFNRIFCIRNMA